MWLPLYKEWLSTGWGKTWWSSIWWRVMRWQKQAKRTCKYLYSDILQCWPISNCFSKSFSKLKFDRIQHKWWGLKRAVLWRVQNSVLQLTDTFISKNIWGWRWSKNIWGCAQMIQVPQTRSKKKNREFQTSNGFLLG